MSLGHAFCNVTAVACVFMCGTRCALILSLITSCVPSLSLIMTLISADQYWPSALSRALEQVHPFLQQGQQQARCPLILFWVIGFLLSHLGPMWTYSLSQRTACMGTWACSGVRILHCCPSPTHPPTHVIPTHIQAVLCCPPPLFTPPSMLLDMHAQSQPGGVHGRAPPLSAGAQATSVLEDSARKAWMAWTPMK